jgi:flagellum-specific ATP synthase
VFSLLPKLLERAGTSETGSITGLYTVLVDADDMNEPIGDAARSILDGHIVLSRRLATAGHYPCVDVLESVSRVAPRITDRDQRTMATVLRQLLAARRDAQDLIDVGAYVPGTNALVDRATQLGAGIDGFLRQEATDVAPAEDSWRRLTELVGPGVAV